MGRYIIVNYNIHVWNVQSPTGNVRGYQDVVTLGCKLGQSPQALRLETVK
jgi:hypothetical protein